jgi:hypothetical protein
MPMKIAGLMRSAVLMGTMFTPALKAGAQHSLSPYSGLGVRR